MASVFLSAWRMIVDVVLFWYCKLREWLRHRSPVDVWLDVLRGAPCFEEWEEAALHLDNLIGIDSWRDSAASRYYDWRLIRERLASIVAARQQADVHALVNLLRSGLVRNLGNITAPKLYNRCFAGTKFLIEEYITQVAEAIEDIGSLPTQQDHVPQQRTQKQQQQLLQPHQEQQHEQQLDTRNGDMATTQGSSTAVNGTVHVHGNGGHRRRPAASRSTTFEGAASSLSTQMKLDFVHDTRQAFGRSTLVLQGGAIFGLCHLGVVKALFLRGLLPRIITGIATGALIAALVAIHTEEELPDVLSGDGIDLSAFSGKGKPDDGMHPAGGSNGATSWAGAGWEADSGGRKGEGKGPAFSARWETLMRRLHRFRREGYFLDVKVLEECVRANVGDLTFEEAYQRSKRVLNITVATAQQGGVPTLLNYLTAPNVLIWTAAVASNASTPTLRETTVLCKDPHGNIIPWKPANTADFRHWTHVSYSDRESPLRRIAELFNVNHFIVSQARPYLIPFLQSDVHGPSSVLETGSRTTSVAAFIARMVGLEIRHRLRQLDTLRLLPAGIRRFLVDERVPGASVTLVPEVTAGDFVRLLETPTRDTLAYWILRGERSVWPAVAALRIRCVVETELDRAYQQARRLKAGGLRRRTSSAAVRVLACMGQDRDRDMYKQAGGEGAGREGGGDSGTGLAAQGPGSECM